MRKLSSLVWIRIGPALFALALTACGGGGGGGGAPPGPAVSTLDFPLRAALTTLAANGFSANLTATGTPSPATLGVCSGTLSVTTGPANTAANFEGVAGFSAASVETLTLTNCLPANTVVNVTDFYNSTYVPLGYTVAGGDYAVWQAPPNFPISVKVGDNGMAGTIDTYTDGTKTVLNGRAFESWQVTAETANTVLVHLQSVVQDGTLTTQFVENDMWRLTSTGAMTLLEVRVDTPTGPGGALQNIYYFR
jgi:hypothetical protein